jgi:hypothetical protein
LGEAFVAPSGDVGRPQVADEGFAHPVLGQVSEPDRLLHGPFVRWGYLLDEALDQGPQGRLRHAVGDLEGTPVHFRLDVCGPGQRLGLGLKGLTLAWEAATADLGFPLVVAALVEAGNLLVLQRLRLAPH